MDGKLLNESIQVDRISAAEAAATTDITSDAIDMQGYRGCLVMVHYGTLTTGHVTLAKMQQSDDDGVSDGYSDIANSATTALANDDDDEMDIIDIYKPGKRYLKCVVDRGTQNAVVDAITVIKYDPINVPVTQSADIHEVVSLLTPAEGTA